MIRVLALIIVFLLPLVAESSENDKHMLGLSISYNCEDPYRIFMTVENMSHQGIELSEGQLPWAINARSIHVKVVAIEGNKHEVVRSTYPIADYFGSVSLAPGEKISGTHDLQMSYPDLKETTKQTSVLASFRPGRIFTSGLGAIVLHAPSWDIYFPERAIFGSVCPSIVIGTPD